MKVSENGKLGPQKVDIIMDLALGFGFGRQIAMGLKHFRTKRPDWFFRAEDVRSLPPGKAGQLASGAIGHFGGLAEREALVTSGLRAWVGVSNRLADDGSPRVIVDDRAVGHLAADYFLGRGYTNFGYLENPWNHFAKERADGFRKRLRKAGFREIHRFTKWEIHQAGKLAARSPLGLFAISDHGALEAITSLLGAGAKVPEDVAVLGVDDDEIINLVSPVAISSIRLPLEKLGFMACELLEGLLEGTARGQPILQRLPPLNVIERRSTQADVVSDARVRRAQAYVEAHLRSLAGVEEVALAVNLSRRTLERLFFEALGTSPGEWIMRRRAARAEQLLRETDYTVEYIADLAGFEDRRRLYRAFKKLRKPLPRSLRGGGSGIRE